VAAGREAGRRIRMQSTFRPAIRVVVGYNSTLCPGQSRLSSQPVISTIESQFVAFNTNFFSLPTKDRTDLFAVLPLVSVSSSRHSSSISTTTDFPFRSSAIKNLRGYLSLLVAICIAPGVAAHWEIAKVRGSGLDLSKLGSAPKRAAITRRRTITQRAFSSDGGGHG